MTEVGTEIAEQSVNSESLISLAKQATQNLGCIETKYPQTADALCHYSVLSKTLEGVDPSALQALDFVRDFLKDPNGLNTQNLLTMEAENNETLYDLNKIHESMQILVDTTSDSSAEGLLKQIKLQQDLAISSLMKEEIRSNIHEPLMTAAKHIEDFPDHQTRKLLERYKELQEATTELNSPATNTTPQKTK